MTNPIWILRKIATADLEAFRTIRLEALHCAPAAFANCYEDWNGFSEAEWLARMSFPIYIAYTNGEPVGIMGLNRQEPRKMRHRATLTMVYVRQALRGSGLASALLNEVFTDARKDGISQIELVVRSDNHPAIQFYRRNGFVQVGLMPDGFIDADQACGEEIMVKQMHFVTSSQ